MNLGIKNTLIIVITLLLGILIGFLISGRITRLRIDNMRQDFVERGMERRIIKAIRPTDEQMQKLRPVFEEYNRKRILQMESHFGEQKEMYNEFEKEISQYLNDEQIQRLERLKQNLRDEFPGRRGNNDRQGGMGRGNMKGNGEGNGPGKRYRGGRK